MHGMCLLGLGSGLRDESPALSFEDDVEVIALGARRDDHLPRLQPSMTWAVGRGPRASRGVRGVHGMRMACMCCLAGVCAWHACACAYAALKVAMNIASSRVVIASASRSSNRKLPRKMSWRGVAWRGVAWRGMAWRVVEVVVEVTPGSGSGAPLRLAA